MVSTGHLPCSEKTDRHISIYYPKIYYKNYQNFTKKTKKLLQKTSHSYQTPCLHMIIIWPVWTPNLAPTGYFRRGDPIVSPSHISLWLPDLPHTSGDPWHPFQSAWWAPWRNRASCCAPPSAPIFTGEAAHPLVSPSHKTTSSASSALRDVIGVLQTQDVAMTTSNCQFDYPHGSTRIVCITIKFKVLAPF